MQASVENGRKQAHLCTSSSNADSATSTGIYDTSNLSSSNSIVLYEPADKKNEVTSTSKASVKYSRVDFWSDLTKIELGKSHAKYFAFYLETFQFKNRMAFDIL